MIEILSSVADPDRVTGFLEPGQNFQMRMKMDKNLIFFCEVFLTQNRSTICLDPPLKLIRVFLSFQVLINDLVRYWFVVCFNFKFYKKMVWPRFELALIYSFLNALNRSTTQLYKMFVLQIAFHL